MTDSSLSRPSRGYAAEWASYLDNILNFDGVAALSMSDLRCGRAKL